MEDIKEIFERYKRKLIPFLVAVTIVTVVVIPAGINILFKWNSELAWLQAEWTAGDALTFYGTLLAAGIGVLGVFVSIWYAQKSYKEDARNQVRPYFAITKLQGTSNYSLLWDILPSQDSNEKTDEDGEQHSVTDIVYEETEVKRVYIIIGEKTISYKTCLNSKEKTLLKTKGTVKQRFPDGVETISQTSYISVPLIIENVGNGPAICTRIGLTRNDAPNNRTIVPIQMKKGDRFYIHMFSSASKESINGEYKLSITCQDIYQNGYAQKFPFSVNNKGCSLNLDVNQQRLNRI